MQTCRAIADLFYLLTIPIITIITQQRYVAVCKPFYAKQFNNINVARKQVTGAVIFCSIYIIPSFFQRTIKYDAERGLYYVTSEGFWATATYDYIYNVAARYSLFYVAPMAFLMYATFKLIRSLHHVKKFRQSMTASKVKDVDLTRCLVTVVIMCMISQLMMPSLRIGLAITGILHPKCGDAMFYFIMVSTTVIMLNSALNFVLYFVYVKHFRMRIHELLGIGGPTTVDVRSNIWSVEQTSGSQTVPQSSKGKRRLGISELATNESSVMSHEMKDIVSDVETDNDTCNNDRTSSDQLSIPPILRDHQVEVQAARPAIV